LRYLAILRDGIKGCDFVFFLTAHETGGFIFFPPAIMTPQANKKIGIAALEGGVNFGRGSGDR
jgi:hypothetical protein